MQKDIPSELADIIVKVRQKQRLTGAEHLLYLIHVKKMNEQEAIRFIDKKPDPPAHNTPN